MSFLDDYEPVEDRIRAFWTDHPEGRILTTLIQSEDGDYIFRADVWRDGAAYSRVSVGEEWIRGSRQPEYAPPPDASGYAHDAAQALPNNMKASALEVCETSAIGRALANLGYAAKGKRPSREEMTKASRPDEARPSEQPGSVVSGGIPADPGTSPGGSAVLGKAAEPPGASSGGEADHASAASSSPPGSNSPASPATSGPPPNSGLAAGQESEGDGEAAGSGERGPDVASSGSKAAVQQNPSPAGELYAELQRRSGTQAQLRVWMEVANGKRYSAATVAKASAAEYQAALDAHPQGAMV